MPTGSGRTTQSSRIINNNAAWSGIIKGELKMAKCGQKTEIYSRVVGYFRPVTDWNKGKKEEFKDRKTYLADSAAKCKVA
jgi:anaerobic ribonucleoside-triphosphate reductase